MTAKQTDPQVQTLQTRVAALETENDLLRQAERANRLAAAIAREQEKAAQERAAELAKANEALRRSARNIARNSDIEDILPLFLHEAITASGASAGAVLRRVEQSEFEFVAILQGDELMRGERLKAHPFYSAVKRVSREDQTGWFTRLAVGETLWRLTDDDQAGTLPECEEFHRPHQQQSVWDIPYKIGDRVAGYLGLAFCSTEEPSQVVAETVTALATQVGLALELTELAEAAKQAAIAREQEQAAQERAAELTKINAALQSTIARLATNPDLDAYLGHVLTEAAEQVGAYSNALFVYDQASNTLKMRSMVLGGKIANIQTDPRLEMWRDSVAADISPAWSVIAGEAGFLLHDVDSTDPNAWQFANPWHSRLGHVSVLCVPLRIGDRAIGFMGLCFRVRSNLAAEKIALARALADQATLALELTRLADEAQEAAILEERNRMAGEIHDTLAQAFTGVVMQLQAAERFLNSNPSQTQTCLSRAQSLAKTGLTEARRSVWALYADLDDNLFDRLTQIIHSLTADTEIQIQTKVEGAPYPLSAEQGLNLQRIAQESLTNALRHANAQQITLKLIYTPQMLELHVVDDGQGFDLMRPSSGFGLMGLQQRCDRINATLTIHSTNQGTHIQVVLPIRSDRHVQ